MRAGPARLVAVVQLLAAPTERKRNAQRAEASARDGGGSVAQQGTADTFVTPSQLVAEVGAGNLSKHVQTPLNLNITGKRAFAWEVPPVSWDHAPSRGGGKSHSRRIALERTEERAQNRDWHGA